MLVPPAVQEQIVQVAPAAAYAPATLPAGWRLVRWKGAETLLELDFRKRGGGELEFYVLPFSGTCAAGSFSSSGGVYWNRSVTRQSAWRCIGRLKLVAETLLPPERLSKLALTRFVASARRLGGG